MIFYWSDEFIESASVRSLAQKLPFVDQTSLTDDRAVIGTFGKTGSGQFYKDIRAHYLLINVIVSWDALQQIRRIGSDDDTIENWLYVWEDAKYTWIEDVNLNGGEPLQVVLNGTPTRNRINDRDDQREFEYSLVESEVHVHE